MHLKDDKASKSLFLYHLLLRLSFGHQVEKIISHLGIVELIKTNSLPILPFQKLSNYKVNLIIRESRVSHILSRYQWGLPIISE